MIPTDRYVIYETLIPQDERPRHEREAEAKLALLRKAFGTDAGVTLSHDENGAPYIPSRPDIYISLSHSRDNCVLAVSPIHIGIDVENWRPQLNRVAPKFLTPAELKILETLTDDDTRAVFLLKAWTAKEATFKAAGQPRLVLSEISLNPYLTQADAHGSIFEINYHIADGTKAIAVAIPAR